MREQIFRCLAGIVALLHVWAATLIIPKWDFQYFLSLIVIAGFTTVFATFALLGSKAAERVLNRLFRQTKHEPKAHSPLRNDD